MGKIAFILIICFFCILLSKKTKNKKYYLLVFLSIFFIGNIDKSIQINVSAKQYTACAYETKLQQYGEYARNSMKQTGVYASLTLAQGIIEQRLGTSNSNNMFGIKATGVETVPIDDPDFTSLNSAQQAKCESINGSWVKTSEWSKSKGTYKAMACFKTYDNVEGSFIDHGEWLLTSFANRNTFGAASTLEDQLSALVNNPVAMYATGENYLCSLISQINACDLTRFDEGVSFNDRGVSIEGNHISNIKIDNCSSYKSEGSINNSNTLEHFGTNYSGDLTKGWIYNRFNFKEKVDLNIPDYMVEKNINDVIDEIFGRAKTSYYASYYAGSTVMGIVGGTPNTSSDLQGRYWYEFDINSYLGNTLFGQCVWYAKHRALEIIDSSNYDDATKQKLLASIKATGGNGQDWFKNPDSSVFQKSANIADARPGSIVSWSRGQYGHVGIVENVYEKDGQTYVTLSEGYRSGGSSSNGWTVSNSVSDAWNHSVVSSKEMTLEQLKTHSGSFNGYVYLTNEE